MKVQLLPSSIEAGGEISQRQHLTCIIIDDRVAFDAGSLALSCAEVHREQIRDIVISHDHLDHIAGLPLFLDDLFSTLREPVLVHASPEMIEVLERDIFNWSIYPKFSELRNSFGPVLEYRPFTVGRAIELQHLSLLPIAVNHNVPSIGALISDGSVSIGITGDTSGTEEIWGVFNNCSDLAAVFIECAFPNEMSELARVSHHMTPADVAFELEKLSKPGIPVYIINIKPTFREQVVQQIADLSIPNLRVLHVGMNYEF
jgi:cAMP phosphodiesterase